MKYLVLLFSILTINANATLKVAVIDTGIDSMNRPNLCATGHKDFTGFGLGDVERHGTNVTGLIYREAKGLDYCVIVLKYFNRYAKGQENAENMVKALIYVQTLNVDIINISSSGSGYYPDEALAIFRLLNKKVKIIVSAGNGGKNLDERCNMYPACYHPKLIVIGNYHVMSNSGSVVDFWENGVNQTGFGITMTGTSQATAIYTGKTIKEYFKKLSE